jgi:CelD/BcsL family acetyltransferase involved in cellulose biosynthesis
VAADPRSDPRWRDLVSTGAGSLFTSPPWIAAVCDCYGFVPQARMLLDGEGRATDGFAWVRVTDARGDRLSSLPFSDRADPLAADPARWRLLARDALATGLPLTVRCLEGSAALDDPAAARQAEAAWHGTPLDVPLGEVHARLSSSARRNVRAASRSGVRVVEGTDLAAVRRLHGLHVRLRKRKYRLLAQPVALFERIRDAFADDDGVLVLLASVDGEPVAGAMYLVWGDVLYYKFGASAAEHLSLRPNEAIGWHALRWASERGLRLLDWGLSDLDQPGLLRYKRKWGALERRIVTARWGPVSPDPASRAIGETLGELTRLLTDDSVPDDITERAGAVLYRYFC